MDLIPTTANVSVKRVTFLSVFMLLLVLPVMLFIVNSATPLTFLSRADRIPELRLWLEPATVVVKPNQTVTLDLIAEFDAENKILPQFTAALEGDASFRVDPTNISYAVPFRGRKVVQQIEVIPNQTGTYKLTIPETLVKSSFEALNVFTSPATFIVK